MGNSQIWYESFLKCRFFHKALDISKPCKLTYALAIRLKYLIICYGFYSALITIPDGICIGGLNTNNKK